MKFLAFLFLLFPLISYASLFPDDAITINGVNYGSEAINIFSSTSTITVLNAAISGSIKGTPTVTQAFLYCLSSGVENDLVMSSYKTLIGSDRNYWEQVHQSSDCQFETGTTSTIIYLQTPYCLTCTSDGFWYSVTYVPYKMSSSSMSVIGKNFIEFSYLTLIVVVGFCISYFVYRLIRRK